MTRKTQFLRISLTVVGLFMLLGASAQNINVKGSVSDETNQPVIGANVVVKGSTSVGTATDLDGNFTLSVPKGSVLVASFIGYLPQEVKVTSSIVRIVLKEDNQLLEDVVIIGYGTVKKTDLTGSVAAIKADQINKGMVTSPAELLRGKAAGVTVTTGDGQPGSAAKIRIRGGSSLSASNDPLVIIDGLPITNTSLDGLTDQLSAINSADIESFSVLKDASATAIYGSRASNGVIIITTKKGAQDKSKPTFDFDASMGVKQNTDYVDVLDGDQMRATISQRYGAGSQAYAALGTANTDWQKEIYRLATSIEANGSVKGNVSLGQVGAMPYRVSLGMLTDEGTLKTSNMDRYTAGVSLQPTLLDKHLTITLNGKGTFVKNRFGNSNAVGGAVNYDPTQPLYADNSAASQYTGVYRIWTTNGNVNTMASQNPLALLYEKKDLSTAKRFIGNAQFDYKVHGFEDLRFNLNLGLDYTETDGTVDVPIGAEQSWHNTSESGSGYHTGYGMTNRDQTLEFYGNYTKDFLKLHHVDVMGGYSWQHFYYDRNSTKTKATDGTVIGTPSTSKSELYLVSYFGRLNYSFADRYMITGTLRDDGTSRFQNNEWGLFPSVAVAWNVKNEKFLKDNNLFSTLKLRLSWGKTGQQDLNSGNYPSLASYYTNQGGSYYMFGGQTVIPITAKGYNTDLKWETTTTYNIGLDWGLFAGRLYGSVDLYQRKTTDLLNNTPIAVGANLVNYLDANIGTLENKGIEAEVNVIPVQNDNWYWKVGASFSYNKNKITKLIGTDDPTYTGVATGGISGGVGNNVQRYMVGYPERTFYVYQQIYDQNGDPIEGAYVDRSKDGKIDEHDLYCYKQAAPKYTLGLNTELDYKNWTFSASGHGNFGNYVYNNVASNLDLLTDLWTNSFVRNILTTSVNTGFGTSAQYLSDYYVENASFFRIDNITLGYNFTLNKAKINVYGTVQNVYCFTDYSGLDPEVFSGIDNNMYPRPRTYMIGAKFNF